MLGDEMSIRFGEFIHIESASSLTSIASGRAECDLRHPVQNLAEPVQEPTVANGRRFENAS